MTITYFQGTDSLHIEFRAAEVSETREPDEHTRLECANSYFLPAK